MNKPIYHVIGDSRTLVPVSSRVYVYTHNVSSVYRVDVGSAAVCVYSICKCIGVTK